MTADQRYDGKPMLRLLDSWVLWTIGELDPASVADLDTMTPSLRRAFGMSDGTWQAIVETKLDLGEDDAGWVRDQWDRQVSHDIAVKQPHNPVVWSRAVSDMISGHEGPPA